MFGQVNYIALDADDTLWENEIYFHETEDQLANLLKSLSTKEKTIDTLYHTEMNNIPYYGFGIKGFTLSMIETALKLTGEKAGIPGLSCSEMIKKILNLGKSQLMKPVNIIDGVVEVLDIISKKFCLIVATKGDLLDQERKLEKSGIAHYFHHIEVMSDKKEENYLKLLNHLDCRPEQFLMVGNSIRSDILPVLNIGAYAVNIPFHITWKHEESDETIENERFIKLESIKELPRILNCR